MYNKYYNFRDKPFCISPDPEFLFLTQKHKKALMLMRYALATQAGFAVVTGEVGSGKTTLISEVISQDSPNLTIGVINNTQCTDALELMQWILFAFDLDYSGKSHVELYDTFTKFLINEYSEGRNVAIIIDEAQHLGMKLLEQVRLLSNLNSGKHTALQFLIVGQPELRDQLAKPEFQQFTQRVIIDYHLNALNFNETIGYIRHRLLTVGGSPSLFCEEGMHLIWEHSGGVPRLINVLCDLSLVYGYSAQLKDKIYPCIIKEVLHDKGMEIPTLKQVQKESTM